MLIELYGKNFGCFRDEFRLSMLATDIDRDNDRGIVRVKIEGEDEPLELLRCVAIYGPNASGKSTVLRAGVSLAQLLSTSATAKSNDALYQYEPFALGPQKLEPSLLGATIVLDSRVYQYTIEFNKSKILAETLKQLSNTGERLLFRRSDMSVEGDWVKDEQFTLIMHSFRPNALLLALADSFAPKLAQDIAVGFRSFNSHESPADKPWFSVHDDDHEAAIKAQDDSMFASWLRDNLGNADVGVEDFRVEVSEGREQLDLFAVSSEPVFRISLLHSTGGKPVAMPFGKESYGTRQYIKLAPMFFDLTHKMPAQIALRDEIDSSIHPHLLRHLLGHLNCEVDQSNIHGQLICTTHETSLLDGEAKSNILRRDQIYFTEKGSSGAARLYSLAEFKERSNLNLRRRYLQGRYGALPALGTFTE